jgi:hypothetical protein
MHISQMLAMHCYEAPAPRTRAVFTVHVNNVLQYAHPVIELKRKYNISYSSLFTITRRLES